MIILDRALAPAARVAAVLASIAALPAQTLVHSFSGAISPGQSVRSAGDVDADGVADVIVGQPMAALPFIPFSVDVGCVAVYSGATGLELYRFYGQPSSYLGWSVSGAGDVNGDGHDDFIAGAPRSFAFVPGSAIVYSGADGSVLHTLNGNGFGDYFGRSVSGAGDVNADGFADVIIGDDQLVWGQASGALGYARVVSGRDGSTLYQFTGASFTDRYGWAVRGVGDANADGYDDVVVGAPGAHTATVYSGADGSVLHSWTESGSFGSSVAGAGDVNDDGCADIVVGAPTAGTPGGPHPGAVWVYSGFDGTPIRLFTGVADESVGQAVAGAGDVDGDGCDDIIAQDGSGTGDVHVYSGATSAVLATIVFSAGPSVFAEVDGLGDVDGDGFSDVVVATAAAGGPANVYSIGGTGTPARYRMRGAACLGQVGLPHIGIRGDARIGDSFDVRLRAAAGSSLADLLIGTSGFTALDPIGLTGCSLLVQPFAVANSTTDPNGFARVTFAVANQPATVGLQLEFQWISSEPGAPHALPVALSDALSVVVGG